MDTLETQFIPGAAAHQATVLARRQALRAQLSELFPPSVPVVLELGAGHGHFLTSYASAHSRDFCVGIDLISDRVNRATKKRDRLALKNLAFLRCEAMEFLACLPPEIRFRRVFVLFPDPWPKKRHHKNRLLTDAFLDALAGRCHPGADLYFRTDYRPYFKEVQERVGDHRCWQTDTASPWPFEEPTVFQQRADKFFSLAANRA